MVFSNWVPDEHGVESGNFINSHPENIKVQVKIRIKNYNKHWIPMYARDSEDPNFTKH